MTSCNLKQEIYYLSHFNDSWSRFFCHLRSIYSKSILCKSSLFFNVSSNESDDTSEGSQESDEDHSEVIYPCVLDKNDGDQVIVLTLDTLEGPF